MNVTVYSKPLCVQCDATKRALNKQGSEYDVIDLTEDASALEKVKELGFAQAPVVVVSDESGSVLESWSGFVPGKVKKIAQGVAAFHSELAGAVA